MPPHIYIRVGRYHDGTLANERAIQADRAYVTQCHAQGLYSGRLHPAQLPFPLGDGDDGGTKRARDRGRANDGVENRHVSDAHGWVRNAPALLGHPLYAQVRFGRWDAIRSREKPADDLVYPRAVWHYAQAVARLWSGRLEQARTHLDSLQRLTDHPNLEEVTVWDINTTAGIMAIAARVVAGELSAEERRWDEAIHHLREGAQLEDALNYTEPPSWHHPVRQTLGAVLLEAGRPVDAETAYREDLERFPENGWSLYGLTQSLRAQGKTEEAEATEQRFEEAWRQADVSLTSSRF